MAGILSKKIGRPPLPPEKRKLQAVGFRPTPEVRRKLEEAAIAAGRIMSQEIQSRLEYSFVADQVHETMAHVSQVMDELYQRVLRLEREKQSARIDAVGKVSITDDLGKPLPPGFGPAFRRQWTTNIDKGSV